MPYKILDLVPAYCHCHGRSDCPDAVRRQAERERILAGLDATPGPVSLPADPSCATHDGHF